MIVLVIPLYPQYAASAAGSVYDAVCAAMMRLRDVPALRLVKHFHDHPGYIQALAQNIRDHWMVNGRPEKLVMSFHGVPRFTLDRGDPYHCECHKTGRLLGEALALKPDYAEAYFNRSRPHRVIKPYTMDTMLQLGRQKLKRDAVCPGFVSDCLETLEEIAIENRRRS
jgi:ferrochelatase